MGTEYNFYPDFICQKPKLKWNLMKFDFLRTQESDLNWCIPTVNVTGTKQRLRWLMPMEALDQIRVEDKCDDYELGHSASARVH